MSVVTFADIVLAENPPFKDLTWQTLGPKFAGGRIESIDAPRGDIGTIYAGVGAGGLTTIFPCR